MSVWLHNCIEEVFACERNVPAGAAECTRRETLLTHARMFAHNVADGDYTPEQLVLFLARLKEAIDILP